MKPLPPMDPEQTERHRDVIADVIRTEIVAAEERAQHAGLLHRLGGCASDTVMAAEIAIGSLREALSGYVVYGSEPTQSLLIEINGGGVGPFADLVTAARRVALEGLVARLVAPAPAATLTREEAVDLLVDVSIVLRHRLGCGSQASDVGRTAEQLGEHDRGPIWMLRQARGYRRAKIIASRAMSSDFNVRASFFVAAILRACAAGVDGRNS